MFADFSFEVRSGNMIHYENGFEPFLDGLNTDTLIVRGFTIRFDATALSAAIFILTGGTNPILNPDRAQT